MTSYQSEHEAFVSDNEGTTIDRVVTCLAHIPLCIFLVKLLQLYDPQRSSSIVRDIVFFVIPMLLYMTILEPYTLIGISIFPIIVLFILFWNYLRSYCHSTERNQMTDTSIHGHIDKKHISFLTLFKGANMIITCIAILAVDFPIFPRYFAKTEKFGISLMDVGVGTFITSSAVTSKFARYGNKIIDTIDFINPLNMNNSSTISWGIPAQRFAVLLLGIGRMMILKVVDYHEHVSEYGIHWNFFVTLFFVWTISDGIHQLMRYHIELVVLFSIVWLILYQVILLTTGLTDFLLDTTTRSNFYEANKEGIISLMGYCPMYLLAECIAQYCFYTSTSIVSSQQTPTGRKISSKSRFLITHEHLHTGFLRVILQPTITFWIFWYALHHYVQPTSRRMANATYVMLTLAISFSLMTSLYIADYLTGSISNQMLSLTRISRHSLFVFMAANLATGLVNMTVQTIHASTELSLCILIIYSIAFVMIGWSAGIIDEQYQQK